MTLAEAVAVVRDQTIPSLDRAAPAYEVDVEALRVLLAEAETMEECISNFKESSAEDARCISRLDERCMVLERVISEARLVGAGPRPSTSRDMTKCTRCGKTMEPDRQYVMTACYACVPSTESTA